MVLILSLKEAVRWRPTTLSNSWSALYRNADLNSQGKWSGDHGTKVPRKIKVQKLSLPERPKAESRDELSDDTGFYYLYSGGIQRAKLNLEELKGFLHFCVVSFRAELSPKSRLIFIPLSGLQVQPQVNEILKPQNFDVRNCKSSPYAMVFRLLVASTSKVY